MTTKQKEILEELKQVRLEMFRMTASLDNVISDLELGIKDDDREYLKHYIVCLLQHRKEIIRVSEWNKLLEKENELCLKLQESI